MGEGHQLGAIVNPRAANGRTGKRWPHLERSLRKVMPNLRVYRTQAPGHGTDLTRQALREGCDRIAVIGGDGTVFEVLNGYFHDDNPINPQAALALMPQGTGSDLARMLGIKHWHDGLDTLTHGKPAPIDVGHVQYTGPDGAPRSAYCVNVSHIGLGGAVAERMQRTTKAFGGHLSYLWGITASLFSHQTTTLHLDLDGEILQAPCLDIIIANGRHDGGGMVISPEARLDSGVLELYLVDDTGRLTALKSLRYLYNGRLAQSPWVRRVSVKRFTASAQHQVPINLDGEFAGYLPATFQVRPKAVNILMQKTLGVLV